MCDIKDLKKGWPIVTEQELIDFAIGCGFEKVKIVNTSDIVFDPSFRPYCAENFCGHYNENYTCPPVCGTPEEMKQKIICHKKALVLESRWKVKDYSDKPAIDQGKTTHNHWELQILKQARSQGIDGFIVGSSGCSLCTPCKMKTGEPCRFPDLRWSCMSAYCIFVKKLSDLCGMDYNSGPGYLTLYGMFVFD